jgi:2-polyprenyl-6-methoxyphenol hydroxylase-like FAD-dependent oxidoreductase
MVPSPRDTTEVLIVGAGPTGLMMACQLAVHDVSFRIIDKNAVSSQNSGALIVQPRTLEIFQQLGIADEAINQGMIADEIIILYNAKKIAGTSIKDIGRNLSPFPFLLMLEQSETEKLLLKFLRERGCYVERNVRFKNFTEDQNSITTRVIMPDGSEQAIASKYLIGADGSKSAVRDFLDIPFQGRSYVQPIFIIDCMASSEFLPGVIVFAFSGKSVAGFFPLRNHRWRVDGSFPGMVKKRKNVQSETVIKGFPVWNNLNFKIQDTEWFSISHSQQKYARTIRVGNCFLAGDAAHVNTPVGAQGMNTGLQDVHNLAWKLAFVLKQKAKPELLDSYSTERMGVSKKFARYADLVFRWMTNPNFIVRLLRPYALQLFFKRIFPKLVKYDKLQRKFFKSISQIDIHYKPAIASNKEMEKLFLPGTPRPGHRLPYVDFAYGNKNENSHRILNAKGFTLLVLAEGLTTEMESIAGKYKLSTVLLKHLPETDQIYSRLGITNSGYYIIRPDMHIGLRSPTTDCGPLRQYLEHILIAHQPKELHQGTNKSPDLKSDFIYSNH